MKSGTKKVKIWLTYPSTGNIEEKEVDKGSVNEECGSYKCSWDYGWMLINASGPNIVHLSRDKAVKQAQFNRRKLISDKIAELAEISARPPIE